MRMHGMQYTHTKMNELYVYMLANYIREFIIYCTISWENFILREKQKIWAKLAILQPTYYTWKVFGTLLCFALGPQIPLPLIFDFSFFLLLILGPAGGSNPARPNS